MMTAVMNWFQTLPRAGKWGVLFAIACAAYFGILEPAMLTTSRLSAKADALDESLSKLDALGGSGGDAVALSSFGAPLLPGDPESRQDLVYNAVNTILARHGVRDRDITERQSPLRNEDAAALLGSSATAPVAGERSGVTRLILEITFDASPETISAVVADLEAAPEIATISRVKVDRNSGANGSRSSRGRGSSRNLRATIVPEAWVATSQRSGSSATGTPSVATDAPETPAVDPAPAQTATEDAPRP
jgi:hypothetical protein